MKLAISSRIDFLKTCKALEKILSSFSSLKNLELELQFENEVMKLDEETMIDFYLPFNELSQLVSLRLDLDVPMSKQGAKHFILLKMFAN